MIDLRTIGKVGITPIGIDDAAARIIAAANAGEGRDVHLVNAFTVANADVDAAYAVCLDSAWLNLADGLPLQWISRWSRDTKPLRQVRGADLMRRLLSAAPSEGLRHFFLGVTPEKLALLSEAVRRDFPDAVIAGTAPRPYRPMTDEERLEEAEAIRMSGANLVWMSVGSPVQDTEVALLAQSVPAVCVAVGAAFDFMAGTRPEAPPLLRKLGFEWLFRLYVEPRRLWRRYLSGNVRFIRIVLATELRRGHGPRSDA